MALVSLFFTAFAIAAPNLPDPANIPRLETQPAPPVITSPNIEKKDSEIYPSPLQTKSDIQVTISQLKFSGNKNVSDAQLSTLLVDFLDKPIGIKELNQMMSQVTRYYRQQGFMLAEAYLPEQDIASTLQIAVVEGYLGELKLQTKGKLDETFLKKMAAHELANNTAIRESNLVKNITLINSLPGVRAVSELAPGREVGYSDVSIEVEAQPRVAGYISANTYGNRFTGREVLNAGIYVNNLAGRGDRLGLNFKNSNGERQRAVQLGYIVPITEAGTILNLNAGYSDYRLGGEFSILGATGDSAYVSAFLDQPLLRSRQGNITSRVGLSYKDVSDDVSAFALENHRSINALELGLFGDWRDGSWNGFNQLGMNLKFAGVNFKNSLAKSLDATGAETAGNFVKYNLFGSRIQPLSADFNLIFRAEFQGANNNLDSAEKLAIGGVNRWREFGELPTSSDRGLIVGVELRKRPVPLTGLAKFLPIFNGADASPYVFFDSGKGIINHHALSDDNHVRSSHVGAGIDMLFAKGWTLDLTVSHQESKIEGVDTERETRAWGRIQKEF
ncbi:MAG: ShlB/FhaC/HecB family hemolysin secretion/activation protein [Methylotenera sp.]